MLTVRTMNAADVAFGLRLTSSAGWNQLESDWLRAFDLDSRGCFVGELSGEPVGTVVATVFEAAGRIAEAPSVRKVADQKVAWISMMLVAESARGLGVGRRLMEAALAYLDGLGVTSVRLDATPLGRPLYEKLGFDLEFALNRHGGAPVVPSPPPVEPSEVEVRRWSEADWSTALALDARATGINRERLLRRLLHDETADAWCGWRGDELVGFQMKRTGAVATQLGPCVVADSPETAAGEALLSAALRRHAGSPVVVDVPASHPAEQVTQRFGLTPRRPLYRMTRGPRVRERPRNLWAAFGPEKG